MTTTTPKPRRAPRSKPTGPREVPILFSAAMVRAILDGSKTETRRVIKPQPTAVDGRWAWPSHDEPTAYRQRGEKVPASALKAMWPEGCARPGECMRRFARWQTGDLLYVREAWRTLERPSDMADGILFRADDEFRVIENTREAADLWGEANANGKHGEAWRPSIHLPRWASRLWLRVTSVRAERLQDITEAGARAEGAKPTKGLDFTARHAFEELWETINGAESWAANPWVWVVAFERVAAPSREGRP